MAEEHKPGTGITVSKEGDVTVSNETAGAIVNAIVGRFTANEEARKNGRGPRTPE